MSKKITTKGNGRTSKTGAKKSPAKSIVNTGIELVLDLQEGPELELLRPQDLAKLIKAEQAYSDHVQATRPKYPEDPTMFDRLTPKQVEKRGFLGKLETVSPTDLDGLRRVIADCREAGVPVWMRSIGKRPRDPVKGPEFGLPVGVTAKGFAWDVKTKHPAGSDPSEWPSDLRVQQVPKCLEGE